MNRVSPGPWAMVWSWSGHSPPLSHMGQSSGWLISSSSRLPSWPALATSEVTWVLTSMPSVTVVVQAVRGLRWPATSTRHWRHAPRGASSRWSQNRGTIVPSCSAARITSVPGGTSSSWPSMVTFTLVGLSGIEMALLVCSDGHARPREGAAAADVLVELVAEELQGGDDRAGGPVAEGAERAPEDRVADVLEGVHVLGATLAGLQPAEDLAHPVGALPAGGALAAGLVGVELGEVEAGPDDADVLGEDHHRGRAEQAAGAGDALEVHRGVEVVGGQHRGRGPSRGPGLEGLAVAHPAGRTHDDLAGGHAQGELEVAGVDDVAGDAEQLGAGRLVAAHRPEPVDALADDPGNGGDRLDVVDGGRGPVQALDGREGRAQLGLAALALQRRQQGRLLAADVGPGAPVQDHVQVEPRALDVAAEQAPVVGGVERRLEPPARPAALAAQVDEGVAAADGVGGDDHALDQGVRVALEQLHVLEGARLALVGVDHQVGRLAGPLGQEPPLHAGGEPGPAPAPQPRVLDQLNQVLGGLPEGGVEAGVAVQLPEPVDLVGPPVLPAGGQHLDLVGHGVSPRSGWVGASGAAPPAPWSGWGSPASRCSVDSGGDGSRPMLRSVGTASPAPRVAGGSPRPARRQCSPAVEGSVTDPSAAKVGGGTSSRSRASSTSSTCPVVRRS